MFSQLLGMLCTIILLYSSPAHTAKNSAPSTAKKVRDSTLPNGMKLSEYSLSNGLQILIVPDKTAPVFTFQVWFKVGSGTEKLDAKLKRTGLAHLFEHMMFRGTPKYPDQIFDRVLSAAGAVGENATTWLDRTNYFESLPKEKLELAFDLESDRMVNLALDQKLFDTERETVFGELKMNQDKPALAADYLLWETAFDVHTYKWSTIGKPEELSSFTVDEAQYFYKTYYAPNNATLLIIGDVDIPNVLKLAEKYYGKIPRQEIPFPPVAEEPKQTKAKRATQEHPLASEELVQIGYKIPAISHSDTAAIGVLGAMLGLGDGAFLEQGLVQKGLASKIWADHYTLRYPSLFVIGAQIVPGKTEREVRTVIDATLQQLASTGGTPEQLTRARNQYLLQNYSGLENADNLGSTIGEALMSSDNYMRGFESLEEAKKVTNADIKRVASTYFTDENSTTVLITPKDKK